MKKCFKGLVTLFMFILLVIPLTGCGNKKGLDAECKYLHKMSYTEYVKKIEAKESFVLEITSATCSACKGFRPKLIEFLNEYKVDMYYIDLDDFSEEEYDSFDEMVKFSGTPTTIFVVNGEEETVAARLVGNVSKDKIVAKFKSNGIIK